MVDVSGINPKADTALCYFVELKRIDQKWLVTGHGFQTPEGVRKTHDIFQKKYSDALVFRFDNSAATGSQTPASGDDIVEVYSLQHADAVLLAGILNRLIRPDTIKIVSEPATNSIIASGKRKDLEVIEALVLRLDSPTEQALNESRDTDNAPSIATSSPNASTVSSNVIAVVTEYTEAMLSRNADAAALVDSSFKPSWLSQFESSREMTNAHSIQFVSVQVSEKNGLALAVSDEVDISAAYPKSNRGTTACFAVELKRNDQKWLVTRHLFAPSEVARQLIARFQKGSDDAKVITPINAVATEAKNVENDDHIVQIYVLEHTDALRLAGLLEPLVRTDTTTIVADAAKNAIIFRGPKEDLESTQSLLLRLDFDDSALRYRSPSIRVDLEPLKLKVKQVEELTAKIAHEVNAASGDSRDVLRNRLRREVQSSFEARQQLQRTELQKLRQQMERIEQSIETREQIKDEIIELRITELLNPDLRWSPSAGTVSARTIATDSGKAIELRGRREDVIDVREAIEMSDSHQRELRSESDAGGSIGQTAKSDKIVPLHKADTLNQGRNRRMHHSALETVRSDSLPGFRFNRQCA